MFGIGIIVFRSTVTEGALVHLAAASIVASLGILRRPKRTSIETIAATDTQVLGVQDDALLSLVDAIHRTHRNTRGIRAMHTRD
jgi:hypothetical protein